MIGHDRLFKELISTLKLDPAKTQLISGFVDTYLRLNETEENTEMLNLFTKLYIF